MSQLFCLFLAESVATAIDEAVILTVHLFLECDQMSFPLGFFFSLHLSIRQCLSSLPVNLLHKLTQ